MAVDLLEGLNPEQRRAAEAVRGAVCILAGPGTGKTRTITHRIAHQLAVGAVAVEHVLAVTFTDRAADELRGRLAALDAGRVRAATFHAAAWAQLRWFWPRLSDTPLPEVLPSKVPLLAGAARRAGIDVRDVAAEIEWAKARRIGPAGYAGAAAGRDAPLDPEAMASLYRRYEEDKAARGAIDYEDMLLRTAEALEEHDAVAEEVRDRYRSFTVDEYQDVNPAQESLLRAWLGGRDDLCVVGDDDQTIFSFTGATADYLTGFRRSYPAATVVALTRSYRLSPQIAALAGAVLRTKPAAQRRQLRTEEPAGPPPSFEEHATGEAERDAVVAAVGRLVRDGTPPSEIAICYRTNAQSEPYEDGLRDAGIPYEVRGQPGFFERPEVRQGLAALRGGAVAAASAAAAGALRPDEVPAPGGARPARPRAADAVAEDVLRERMGWSPKGPPAGAAARERWESLAAVLAAIRERVEDAPDIPLGDVLDDLDAHAAAGATSAGGGGAVTLMSLHRAKGTEFDAVFLVACEEGLLPISHARTDAEVEEERRLLYVGVTRARRHLSLSWARERAGFSGRRQRRRPSRFLYGLAPGAPARGGAGTRPSPSKTAQPGGAGNGAATAPGAAGDPALVEALRSWRRDRARDDGVPAYVVFPDRTLHAVAAARPASEAALRGVAGFGPKRVADYGADVLALVAATPLARP